MYLVNYPDMAYQVWKRVSRIVNMMMPKSGVMHITYVRPPSDCVVGYTVTDILSNVAKTALSSEVRSQQKMQDDLRLPLRQFSRNIFSVIVVKNDKKCINSLRLSDV